MAVLYIAEFSTMYTGGDGGGQMAVCPPIAQQTLVIGGTTSPSSAFNAATSFIRVHADVICSIALGSAPVATAVQMRLAANQTEYFAVPGGSKIAVITNV